MKIPPCSGYEASDEDLEPVAYDGFGAPLYAHQITDDDLPGTWSLSDFMGGIEVVRGPDWKPEIVAGVPMIPLHDRSLPPEGQE